MRLACLYKWKTITWTLGVTDHKTMGCYKINNNSKLEKNSKL